jgi:hypothetical protein
MLRFDGLPRSCIHVLPNGAAVGPESASQFALYVPGTPYWFPSEISGKSKGKKNIMRFVKHSSLLHALSVTALMGLTLPSIGCDQNEKVLDVETPDGEVEVERNRDTGDVDVEVNGDATRR